MNDTAQTTTRQNMMQRMRKGFTQSGAVGASAATQSQQQPQSQVSSVQPPSGQQEQIDLPDAQKLALFEQVLDQVETANAVQSVPADQATTQQVATQPPQPLPPQPQQDVSVIGQALPQAIQASDPLNPPQAAHSTAKERVETATSPDQSVIDAGASVQYVEHEKTPEIPVEVESYLQKVEDHADMQPHEVVIADGSTEQSDTAYPSRPVIVLPITEEVEEEGQKKSPKFSIRWLVEWSHKIVKMFAGKVIYKETA